jgi:hypothetical protein
MKGQGSERLRCLLPLKSYFSLPAFWVPPSVLSVRVRIRLIVSTASCTARGFSPSSMSEYEAWLIFILAATSA